jgi:hypothetical protein
MNAKIVFAVGITALLVSVLLIGAFIFYLSQRPVQVVTNDPTAPAAKPQTGVTPRPKGTVTVAAEDITRVSFFESEMASRPANSAAMFFSNINVQNFTSLVRKVTFEANGSALKESSTEITVNGSKTPPRNERLIGTIEPGGFAALAQVMADNDFLNEPDSRDITSLPIKKVVTITYRSGEKAINTGHTGKDTRETLAIVTAIKDLDKKVSWRAAN